MTGHREELTKKYFLAYNKNNSTITISVSNTEIALDNYSAILVAHDKNGKIITSDKPFKKGREISYEENYYPVFCLIYDKSKNKEISDNTTISFRALTSPLHEKINRSINRPGLEDYYIAHQTDFSDTYSSIIRCFSEEKNRGAALALIELDFQSKSPTIKTVYDFETSTKRKDILYTLSNRISELGNFEKRDDINSLITYYHPDTKDGKNPFGKGLERNKEILSNLQKNSEHYTIEDLERVNENASAFVEKLNGLSTEYEQAMQNLIQNIDKFKNACQFKDNLKPEIQEKLEKTQEYIQYNELLSKIEEQLKNSHWSKKEVDNIQQEITILLPRLQTLKSQYELEDRIKNHIQKTNQAIDSLDEKIKSTANNLYGPALELFHAEKFSDKLSGIKNNLTTLLDNEEQLSACSLDAISEPFKRFQTHYEIRIKEISTQFKDRHKEINTKLENVVQKIEDHTKKLKGKEPISLREKLINFIFKSVTKEKIRLEEKAVDTLGKIKNCIDTLSSSGNKNTEALKKYFQDLDGILQDKSFIKHRSCLFFRFNPVTSKGIADDAMIRVSELKAELKV